MVISDNATRWNSTYLSMERSLIVESKIRAFSDDFKLDLGLDFMTSSDWDVIRELKQNLEPFWELTIELQSQAVAGNHGAIWEALPAIETSSSSRRPKRVGPEAKKTNSRMRDEFMV
jgi:hypothetical protein